MSATDKLIVTDMIFQARHGVLPIEKRRRQEYRVTVDLELSLARAGRSDDLEQTVNYCAVQTVVREVVEGSHRHLIEALAEEIARRLLKVFPTVKAVQVEVLKPYPPVAFKFSGVAARIRRTRAGRSR